MAARKTPPQPERPVHTLNEKRLDVQRLSRRIKELEDFNPQSVTKRFNDPKVTALQTSIDQTLASVFGNGTVDYHRYSDATVLDYGSVETDISTDWIGARGDGLGGYHRDEIAEAQHHFADGKERALGLLREAVKGLQEEIADAEALSEPVDPPCVPAEPNPTPDKVFVVHGHGGVEHAVAGFLRKLGLQPVILHEQPNEGQTIIEKFEAHSDVGFAVVLLPRTMLAA
jgi:Predicted nucleotide-binding protein containing TIR-like domain